MEISSQLVLRPPEFQPDASTINASVDQDHLSFCLLLISLVSPSLSLFLSADVPLINVNTHEGILMAAAIVTVHLTNNG